MYPEITEVIQSRVDGTAKLIKENKPLPPSRCMREEYSDAAAKLCRPRKSKSSFIAVLYAAEIKFRFRVGIYLPGELFVSSGARVTANG